MRFVILIGLLSISLVANSSYFIDIDKMSNYKLTSDVFASGDLSLNKMSYLDNTSSEYSSNGYKITVGKLFELDSDFKISLNTGIAQPFMFDEAISMDYLFMGTSLYYNMNQNFLVSATINFNYFDIIKDNRITDDISELYYAKDKWYASYGMKLFYKVNNTTQLSVGYEYLNIKNLSLEEEYIVIQEFDDNDNIREESSSYNRIRNLDIEKGYFTFGIRVTF